MQGQQSAHTQDDPPSPSDVLWDILGTGEMASACVSCPPSTSNSHHRREQRNQANDDPAQLDGSYRLTDPGQVDSALTTYIHLLSLDRERGSVMRLDNCSEQPHAAALKLCCEHRLRHKSRHRNQIDSFAVNDEICNCKFGLQYLGCKKHFILQTKAGDKGVVVA